jgi:hypothetical protein
MDMSRWHLYARIEPVLHISSEISVVWECISSGGNLEDVLLSITIGEIEHIDAHCAYKSGGTDDDPQPLKSVAGAYRSPDDRCEEMSESHDDRHDGAETGAVAHGSVIRDIVVDVCGIDYLT